MSAPRGRGGGGDRARGGRGGGGGVYRGANGRGKGNANGIGTPAQDNSERNTPNSRGQRGGGYREGQTAQGTTRASGTVGNPFTSVASSMRNQTPPAQDDYKRRLELIKAERPRLRAQYIKEGRMNPDGQMRLCDSVKLYGICEDMCPEFERVRRIVEEDVLPPESTPETQHFPRKERTPDESRMVKAYSRSAAGMDVELVSELRSPIVCVKTLDYLFARLDNDDFGFLHRWVWDRTRSIRKDLRTQHIEGANITRLVTCLEQCARFGLLSCHQMARSTNKDYAHQQDIEQLNKTMISLKERYTDNRRANIPSENEAEFWAYRLIIDPLIAKTKYENELHYLPSDLRYNPRVQTAIEIYRVLKSVIIPQEESFVQAQSNWKQFWELIKSPRVSYLMACAAEILFSRVRHIVLNSIWRTYRQGTASRVVTVDDWTTDKLQGVLGFDTDKEAIKLCEDFGFIFSVNNAGRTFLDITQRGYERGVLPRAGDVKPQTFSDSIVESKRHGRALSAVIKGMTVQQAKANGLMVDARPDTQSAEVVEDANSLFVPDNSATNTNPFVPQSIDTPSTTLNLVASPFQPTTIPTAPTNPFLKAAAELQANRATSTSPNPGIQPGLFDASTNSIRFTLPGSTGNAPVSSLASPTEASFTSPSTPSNPFLSEASTFAAPQPTSNTNTLQQALLFNFTRSSSKGQHQATPQAVPSFTPTGPLPANTESQEAERQKAEQARQVTLEKQKKEAEARQRVQAARQAQEAEQRRMQAETKRIQQQQRQAEEERQRLLLLERQRHAQQEEARLARIQEKEQAWDALTADVMLHPDEGLLMQFVENAASNIAQEELVRVQRERQEALADEMYKQHERKLKQAGLFKVIAALQRKRDLEQARTKGRERRRRLKEQRAQMARMQEEEKLTSDNANAVTAQREVRLANGTPTASSKIRTRRTKTRHIREESVQNGTSGAASPSNGIDSLMAAQTANTKASINNGSVTTASYSKAYQHSTAPIDQTETDWFALRAMGIDPSKHRKRSFCSTSDEDKEPGIESKRPKLLPPVISSHKRVRSTTAQDQMARFRALQQSFRKSTTSPLQPVNGLGSINGTPNKHTDTASFLNGSASLYGTPAPASRSVKDTSSKDLIAKVKEFMGKSSTLNQSPPDAEYGWGRSVPNLEFSATSTSQPSVLGQSTDAATLVNRAAYWSRPSRFVPRHLYGQGSAAVRAYQDQYSKRSVSTNTRAVSNDDSVVSSPVPVHQTYIPQHDYAQQQQQYSEEETSDAVEVVLDESVIMSDSDGVEQSQSYNSKEESQSSGRSLSQENSGFYQQQCSQRYGEYDSQQYDEDADSEMVDGEDESYGIEGEEDVSTSRRQQYLQPGSDEGVVEDYTSFTTEEDSGLSQYEQISQRQFAQPVQQPVTQALQRQVATQPAPRSAPQPTSQHQRQTGKPGNTQDDAIELSD